MGGLADSLAFKLLRNDLCTVAGSGAYLDEKNGSKMFQDAMRLTLYVPKTVNGGSLAT
jgi:hypothetical protein